LAGWRVHEFDRPAVRSRVFIRLRPSRIGHSVSVQTATHRSADSRAGDPETAFWGEGLIDELATLLGHRSFGITTTDDSTEDLAALGRSLGVTYVVSGKVRRADDRFGST
jgi:hypothetical protein